MSKLTQTGLSADDMEDIKDEEIGHALLEERFALGKQFSIGDYLIKRVMNERTDVWSTALNAYKAPRKYRVLHVDKGGIGWAKEISLTEHPVGRLICLFDEHDENDRYELDPDYADAIIFDRKADYHPHGAHLDQAKLYKEIAAHNKRLKIRGGTPEIFVEFWNTIKVGQTFWFSHDTSFRVNRIDKMSERQALRYDSRRSNFIWITTNKDKQKKLSFSDLWFKTVYTAQPRTYKELKDPIL